MAWYWHGRLVSGLDKVRVALPMINQIRLLQQGATGNFAALVRAVTVDPAMLVYLDGAGSDQAAPNENYSRELLELFTLGLGNYSEADVQAGARALTGWRVRRRDAVAVFDRRSHDDTPQPYLGATVHDVDTVVGAATGHPACAPFVAGKLARAILGRDVDVTLLAELSQQFADGGLELQPLLRAILQAGIDGRAGPTPVVLAPVPWLVQAQRMTGAVLEPRLRLAGLRSAGQVPMHPPNVAGWPGGAAWFTSATVVARTQLASAVASATTENNAAAGAARRGDLDALAFWLGITGGFGPATGDAVLGLADWRSRLVVALVSPEFVLV